MAATALKEHVHTAEVRDAIADAQTTAQVPALVERPSVSRAEATPVAQPLVSFSPAQVEIIKHTYMPGATDDELAVFIAVCSSRQLNPFTRQIYAIERRQKRSGQWVKVWTHQTSIDGFRLVAERTGKYRGQTVPLFCGQDGVWTETWLQLTPPAAAKVGVMREDFDAPIYAVALWREYVQTFEDGNPIAMWAKMPTVMIAKVAEALALRKAFPEELSGLYTDDEMAQAHNVDRQESRRAATTQAGSGGATEPTPTVDPFTSVQPETLTLEQAKLLPLLGSSEKWDGNGGKALGEVPEKTLRSVAKWMRAKLGDDEKLAIDAPKKMDETSVHKFQVTIAAIALVLDHVEKDQGTLPLAGDSGDRDIPFAGASRPSTSTSASNDSAGSDATTGQTSTTAGESMEGLVAQLKDTMDHPLMPKMARAYFSNRVANNKLTTPLSLKIAINMAKVCVQIGDELITILDEKVKGEIEALLMHQVTYKQDTLEKLRDRLAAWSPTAGA
jgi:phage recombination protein Bet